MINVFSSFCSTSIDQILLVKKVFVYGARYGYPPPPPPPPPWSGAQLGPDRWMDGWVYEWVDGYVYEHLRGPVHRFRRCPSLDLRLEKWVDRWVNGWVGVGRWVGEWVWRAGVGWCWRDQLTLHS